VENRDEGVRHRIQILRADRGQDHQANAFVVPPGIPDVIGTAINCDIVAAGGESSGKLFGKGFESAVVGGNSPRTENGQFHHREL